MSDTYESTMYRLRCGTPMPTLEGDMVLHTFMAEKSKIINYLCTSDLPSSKDFRGQGGNLVSANFSNLRNEGRGKLFQGKEVNQPEFVDEGDINV